MTLKSQLIYNFLPFDFFIFLLFPVFSSIEGSYGPFCNIQFLSSLDYKWQSI